MTPTVIVNGPDPGVISGAEQTEATLDTEWAGAIAKNTAVTTVVSASTSTSDGVALSALYIVDNNLAPVMTTSFGVCEQTAGTSYEQFWSGLWQQAAAQGITSFTAAGDSGAAGCDASTEAVANGSWAVSAIGSTPYNISVGGTQFDDNASQYWLASNDPATLASALGYIPESVWNQSGSSGGTDLWAGGGGSSVVFTKPSWQNGPGVPDANQRQVPDVSLAASTGTGYLIYMNGGLWVAGGTSASTPSWASLMVLVVQREGVRQGNANPMFYALLRGASGGTPVFHDVTTGDNTVPGLTGFAAGPGYDRASGIGSPDATLLVQHWSDIIIFRWTNVEPNPSKRAASRSELRGDR